MADKAHKLLLASTCLNTSIHMQLELTARRGDVRCSVSEQRFNTQSVAGHLQQAHAAPMIQLMAIQHGARQAIQQPICLPACVLPDETTFDSILTHVAKQQRECSPGSHDPCLTLAWSLYDLHKLCFTHTPATNWLVGTWWLLVQKCRYGDDMTTQLCNANDRPHVCILQPHSNRACIINCRHSEP